MAVAAETLDTRLASGWDDQEQYAHSLSSIRRLGALIVEGEVSESGDIEALVRDDFYTGLGENLKTDRDFRDSLDIDPWRNFAVIGGRVTATDGTPIVEMLERGLEASARAAESDQRMANQVARDKGDLKVAREVDQLQAGEMYMVVSMDPKDAMARDGVRYWESKGYREGLAFLQFYYKHTDGGQVTAGAYSVDGSDQRLWRQVQATLGVDIPSDISSDEHIQHALVRAMSPEDVLPFVKRVRQAYYQAAGDYRQRLSLTDYINRHSQLVDGYFNHYIRPLAKAVYSRQNNPTMQNFASVIMNNVAGLKPQIYSGLMRVCNSERFDAQAGRLMESMVRYAVVELLRSGLKGDESGLARASQALGIGGAASYDDNYSNYDYQYVDQQHADWILASNISQGTSAGRGYGGCSELELAERESQARNEDGQTANPQGAFGGAAEGSGEGNGDCLIQTSGCYCCSYNSDGTPRRTPMTVVAVIKSNKVVYCKRSGCGAWLAPGGKAKDKGRIAKRAEALASNGTASEPEDKADEA